MKKEVVVCLIVVLFVLVVYAGSDFMTGSVIGGPGDSMMGGPSDSDVACMQSCVDIGCDVGDDDCRVANSGECGLKCGVETEKPKPADDSEACMQKCVVRGCDEFDFSCQRLRQNVCDDECGMKGDAP
ncbi:MAG: hypothetical protein KJ592_04185, partial [Nanoarchaeota archaeon]|nr:hypothetical protein [Nanoarchaeota archaeon]